MDSRTPGLASLAYITGEAREQVTMFPLTLDELIPQDHLCRVIEAFALLQYLIFGHQRFLLRGRGGAHREISLATMAYNLKRMTKALGGNTLRAALAN